MTHHLFPQAMSRLTWTTRSGIKEDPLSIYSLFILQSTHHHGISRSVEESTEILALRRNEGGQYECRPIFTRRRRWVIYIQDPAISLVQCNKKIKVPVYMVIFAHFLPYFTFGSVETVVADICLWMKCLFQVKILVIFLWNHTWGRIISSQAWDSLAGAEKSWTAWVDESYSVSCQCKY